MSYITVYSEIFVSILFLRSFQAPRKECGTQNHFLISQLKHMFKLMDKKIIAFLHDIFCLTGPMASHHIEIIVV